MAYDPITCEPLRVWNRLESRAREVDFDRALQAQVHDPAWMLARQWQFGEFKGEDTGSAVLAKLARHTSPIVGVCSGSEQFEPYSKDVPLEARVEQIAISFPAVLRALTGRQFLLRVDAAAADLPEQADPYDPAHYRTLFREAFPFEVPELDPTDPDNALAVARRRTEAGADRMLQALAPRAFDGVRLFEAIAPGMTWNDLPDNLAIGVPSGHDEMVLATLEGYRAWFAGLFLTPAAADAWNAAQIEYQFACTVPREDGSQLTLTADEYTTGRLDWFSFDLGAQVKPQGTANGSGVQVDLRSVIAAPADFAGMPNPRWWQFEDGAIDLGEIRADSTDIAKIVVAEFALLYGNNWFLVPSEQRLGTLVEIEGIVVTDVFGWRTHVGPATGSSGGLWTRWDLFSLSPRGTAVAAPPLGQHLFLPPVTRSAAESEPWESVTFLRDEISNSVWAVETRVPDGVGSGRDGATVARELRGALDHLEDALGGVDEQPAPTDSAKLRYRLGTAVPENWIPFVPVHKPGDTREIRLQRAAMPRFFMGAVQPVRPLTSILRRGLRSDETQEAPYFINEEEVSRSGVVVDGTLQRARWVDGSVVVWHGRRVRSGRGEGSSGLRFDVVETVDAPQSFA